MDIKDIAKRLHEWDEALQEEDIKGIIWALSMDSDLFDDFKKKVLKERREWIEEGGYAD